MTTNKNKAEEAAWIKELASILDETGLTEIEIEKEGFRVRVSRGSAPITQISAATPTPASTIPGNATAPTPVDDAPANAVKSPMVGTIYLSPSPGADPFISVGARVSKGQTLMIVEAMKTMNPIPSPDDGVIKSIFVDDAQPVEFGEALVVIE